MFSERKSDTSIKLRSLIGWNDDIENNVRDIGEKAKGYKIMHIQEAYRICVKYRWLMYSGIVLGPLSGLLSGIGAVIESQEKTYIPIPIAVACVGFISGIVVAVTKFGKFEERGSHHKLAASKYTSLESNVRRQLLLPRNDRVNAAKYIEWIGNSFDDLFLASPLISRNIYNEYVKIAKENGITVPEEYEITINIDKGYQLQKFNELKDISNISVNDTPSPKSEIRALKHPERNFKGDNQIRRTSQLNHFQEMNKFSDGRMGYEMERMMGMR